MRNFFITIEFWKFLIFIHFKITTNSFIYSLVEQFLETHFHKNNYRGKGVYFWKKLTNFFGFIYPLPGGGGILYEQQLIIKTPIQQSIVSWRHQLEALLQPLHKENKGHSAIVYKTYTTADMNNLCPGYYCGPYWNYTDTSCYVTGLDPTDGTAGGRGNLATPGGLTTGLNSSDSTCPSSCCSSANENCFRTLDNTGNKVYPDEEIMLVFGGTTYRQVNYNGDLLFQDWEDISLDLLNETQKTWSEELLNEMWAYSIKRNTWTWIKPDYNALVYSSFKQPSSRYGHAWALIHITVYESTSKETITRKYMYMYGGFSYDCATACYDLWRYEISYGPQRFYPSPTSTNTWWNRGNHWTLMQQENTGSRLLGLNF